MKKKPGIFAILIAVVMSIVLFIPIVGSGVLSGMFFSVQSFVQPGRETELYQSFENNGGIDFIYDMLIGEMGEEMEVAEGVSVKARELFPKEDVAVIVEGMYHAFLKGETYPVKLDSQKVFLKDKAMEYFDQNAEELAKEKLGELYELASDSQKQEVMNTARKEYEAEVNSVIEEEVASLETELSGLLNDVYENPDYQEFMSIMEDAGYSLTDRTNMHNDMGLVGNFCLVVGVILIVLLLLCHLFRPAGFVTAGVFTLLTGGLMKGGAMMVPSVLGGLIKEETVEGEPLPEFAIAIVEDIMNWFMDGFNKVGMMALGLGAVLFLVGILLFVIKRNSSGA